jgi:formylmethanofuran dehydrogenase subunit E
MNTKAPDIFERIYARHGHRCPMSTLGGRLGLVAVEAAGGYSDDLRLSYGNRTCALDGIAETTGCTEEDGTLVVNNNGRHALQMTTSEGSVELELSDEAMALAGRYRALCNRLEKNWDTFDEDEQVRRRAEMDAMLDEILPQLWHIDDDLLINKIK